MIDQQGTSDVRRVGKAVEGAWRYARIAQTLGYYELDIPAAFWATLKDRGLLETECPVPGGDDA